MSDMRGRIQHAGEEFSAGWFKRLADYLGTTPDDLNDAIRSGQVLSEQGWAEKIAGYIGVDIKWLVSGTGVPRPAGTAPALEKSDVNTSKQQNAKAQQAFMEDLQKSKATAEEIMNHARDVLSSNFMEVLYSLKFGEHGGANDLSDDIVGYVQAYGFSESAFAAIVVGDKLSPRHENGEFLVLEDVDTEVKSPVSMLEPGDEVIMKYDEPMVIDEQYLDFRLGRVLQASNEFVVISTSDGKGSNEEWVHRFEEGHVVYKVLAKFPKSTFFVKEDMIESNPIAVIGQVTQRVMTDGNLFEQIIPKRGS